MKFLGSGENLRFRQNVWPKKLGLGENFKFGPFFLDSGKNFRFG